MGKTRVKNNLHVKKKSRKERTKVEKLLLNQITDAEKTMEQGYLSMEKSMSEQKAVTEIAEVSKKVSEITEPEFEESEKTIESATAKEGNEMEVSKKNVLMEEKQYKISEMAKMVHVEAHVLRYWEEELELPIRRNDLGHRYYTNEDVERFMRVKQLKEKGIQLKGIRAMLDLPQEYVILKEEVPEVSTNALNFSNDKEEKAIRLQMLLKGLVKEAVEECNVKMAEDIKECIVKEMDYQFRVANEEQEQRQNAYNKQQEEYFHQLDEMIQSSLQNRKKRTSLLFKANKSK